MRSKDVRQLDLPAIRSAEKAERAAQALVVDPIPLLPTIRALPTLHRSIEFARELCGLQDKEIYGPCRIDSGAFSRMTSAAAWYPQDERWPHLLQTMKTEIPVIWQVEALGYDWTSLRRHQTETERKLEAAEKRIRQMEHDHEVELQAVARVVGGRR